MKLAAGLKNNSELARVIEVTPQALSNYKKKGEIPSDLVLEFAKIFALSVNWLLTGEGEMLMTAARGPGPGGRIPVEGPEGKEPMVPVMLSALSPEELIYVGKLLKILRGKNESSEAIKNTVDAFLKTLDKP